MNIRKLRIRARERTDLTWRWRAEAALGHVEVQSLRSLPAAVFCVRSLRVRMRDIVRDNQSAASGETVAGTLDQLFQTAARPARGFVPANAGAVVFADNAELLNCLALDWVRGDAGGRWWWQALFPGRSPAEAVEQAWAGQPQHVPTALVRLHEADQSSVFLRALPAATVAAICANVARVFTLEELSEAVARVTGEDRTGDSTGESRPIPVVPGANPLRDLIAEGAAAGPMPWSEWVRVEPNLPPESQTLIVLSALLVRAPMVARSLRFLHRVSEFTGRRESACDQHAPPVQRAGGERAKATTAQAGDSTVIPARPSLSNSNLLDAVEIREPSLRRFEMDEHPQELLVRRGDKTRTVEISAAPAPSAEGVFSTEWGGVFYLINVALALGLYGDFTQPRQSSLLLPVWDFLALLGRRLIGPQFEQDDCWNVLATLSGRATDEPPGAWFEPPEAWRLPVSWLAPFPERAGWRGGSANGRVRLEHPAGFVVLDAADETVDSAAGFRNECDSLGLTLEAMGPLQTSRHREVAPSLDRWVNWLAQYLECRLSRGLSEPDPDALRELVFRHDARVRVNSERVTVQFSLAAHPIALRMAGLDRDPGWVPAAGTTISFQYD